LWYPYHVSFDYVSRFISIKVRPNRKELNNCYRCWYSLKSLFNSAYARCALSERLTWNMVDRMMLSVNMFLLGEIKWIILRFRLSADCHIPHQIHQRVWGEHLGCLIDGLRLGLHNLGSLAGTQCGHQTNAQNYGR